MDVTENRTYKFKGKFKYAFQELVKSEGIRYDNISVSESGSRYALSDERDAGTFEITDEDSYINVRWNFKAKNVSRTFTLEYTINNVVERYNDASIL